MSQVEEKAVSLETAGERREKSMFLYYCSAFSQ